MSSKEDAKRVWDELITNMNNNPEIVDIAKMNGFLKALSPQLLSDESLILSTDNKWAKGYIDSTYKNMMSKELSKITGNNSEVIIVISDFQETEDDSTPEVISHDQSAASSQDSNKEDVIDTGLFSLQNTQNAVESQRSEEPEKTEEKVFHTSHNEESKSSYQTNDSADQIDINKINDSTNTDIKDEGRTFESFVVADTNSYAYGAAYSVAENPGELNNPLFIYGRSGLGKTHLLLAIKNYVNKNYPEKVVYYAPATSLIEDFVNSLGTRDWDDFNKKYRGADMLLLDDVQYLEGAEETTNEFFKIFNEMVAKKKHIVLSADRAPKDINLDERLKSRFSNGVTADIQAPKFETKLKIFQNYIEDLKVMRGTPDLEIPSDVINRVVELSNSNIRNLEGAAASLVVYISYGREGKTEPITVSEAEEVVSKIFFTSMSEKITISDIQRVVESYYKVTHAELLGQQRPRHISQARQVGMYLSRVMTQASYPEIGKAFKKDHSSVVHAYKNIENKRQNNKDFFNEIERISDLIKDSEDM